MEALHDLLRSSWMLNSRVKFKRRARYSVLRFLALRVGVGEGESREGACVER